MNLLFEHGCIITVNPQEEVFRDGWLLVEDGKIAGLGDGAYDGPVAADRRINAAGHAILPGIVDYHTHVCGSLFKGLTEDVDNGFYRLALPMEDVLTHEAVYTLSMLGILEALRGGVTLINDLYHYMDATAQAVADMGIRGVLAHKIIERNLANLCRQDYTLLPEEGRRRLADGIALVEKWHNACNGRILCKLGPHATDTISVELAKQIVDEGRRLGVGFHIHVAQKQQEVAFLRETYGLTPVEYLEETGLLGPDTVAAHCKFLTEHDKTLLRESGLVFAHCCETSGKRGALPPMKEIIDAGVPFCLGTDWLTTDPWTNMRITVIADRLLGCSTQDINAAKALRKSTIEAACALGLGERIGSLEAGKEADLVMLSLQSANLVPLFDDPVATIVYNANRHDVKLVMVQGDILVQHGRLTRQDEAAILREGQRTAASLYRQHLH